MSNRCDRCNESTDEGADLCAECAESMFIKRGATAERARIVAYLRREASDEEMYRDEEAYLRAADAIERGEL